METNNQIPAKNVTEIWLNNISEELLLMERFEKSFRSGVDSLKELSDVFYTLIDLDLRRQYYREASVKTVEMFLTTAESLLVDSIGFMSDNDYEDLHNHINEFKTLLYTEGRLYWYGDEINDYTLHNIRIIKFHKDWDIFINNLIKLRMRFVKALSPVLFTNVNVSNKNIEV